MTDAHTPRLLSDADAAADLAGVARPVSLDDAMAMQFKLTEIECDSLEEERECMAAAQMIVDLVSERDALAVRVRELEAERDAITELNHAQWLALENVRHLGARNRNEEWAQHVLRWCTEAGNAARIMRATPSAPTAVEPDEQRYQLLRRGQHWSVIDGVGDVLRGDDLDAAVDSILAARASKGTK